MTAKIHPTAIVDSRAQLGEDVEIGPYCIIGPDVTLGARTRLQSHVIVEGQTVMGEDSVVSPFASLGAPPQHLAYRGEPTRLVVGHRNIIREHATMNIGTAAAGGLTEVGSDGMYMIECHVGHDCRIGDRVILTKGATLQSVRLAGVAHDLTLGSDKLADYEGKMRHHGSLVAPVVNRFTGARAPIGGKTFQFEANQSARHTLHFGAMGTQPW